MKINLIIDNDNYSANLNDGKNIAITLLPNGAQPSHFGAQACTSETVVAGSFIGDTTQGGSCNANQLTMIPHCNGTHTESISHIINQLKPVYQAIENSIFPSVLISVQPVKATETNDRYIPHFDPENLLVTKKQLDAALNQFYDSQLEGLVVRTLPNHSSKSSQIYGQDNYPTYFTNDAMSYLIERNIKHLMVDFPSVDKMYDDGQLSNHRMFWDVELGSKESNSQSKINKTITEMIFVEDSIKDGFYLCNLQTPRIETDAVPSQPILYPLTKL